MRLGIVGTGKIVKDAMTAISDAGIWVNAICARPHSIDRGREFASMYGIPEVYTDIDELLTYADIDTVYIAVINTVHYDYARRALEKGFNVIMEKPFTVTFEEAQELVGLAREKGLFIFEAITALHNEVIGKMIEDLPKLGSVRMMHANFSQYSSRYDKYLEGDIAPSFDPDCLGGAFWDLNVYNIHFAAALFGAPLRSHYYANAGANGVDTSGVLVMDYGDCKAVCTCAKDSDSDCFIMIQGEKGYMRADDKPNFVTSLTTVIRGEEETEEFAAVDAGHRLIAEFRDFAEMIDSGDHESARYFEDRTLEVMKILQDTVLV